LGVVLKSDAGDAGEGGRVWDGGAEDGEAEDAVMFLLERLVVR
jgi:hypothetical protein